MGFQLQKNRCPKLDICFITPILNSMMLSGSYVIKVMLDSFKSIKIHSYINKKEAPVFTILFQTVVALVLVLTSSFQEVMIYMGFILTLLNALAVAGVFIIRKNKIIYPCSLKYKTPFYPYTPLLFLGLSLWMLIYILIENPIQSVACLLTLVIGFVIYYFLKAREIRKVLN